MPKKFDFAIIGAGLAGAVLARELQDAGASVIMFERRKHTGGNLYSPKEHDIPVHKYGAHIFHTNSQKIWNYIQKFVKINNFTHAPIAQYKNEIYNLPINMNTFYQLFGAKTPNEAKRAVESDCIPCENPQNFENWILSTAGQTIYTKLIKGYTEKQWGKSCSELPVSIIKRIPIRYTFNNSYFNDKWQGIPVDGYNPLIDSLIGSAPVILNCDFNQNRDSIKKIAARIIYTGSIDSLFDDDNRVLEYRSLVFTHKTIEQNDVQGSAVRNYTDNETIQTRTIEHKHFIGGDDKPFTIVSYEVPCLYVFGENEPYYPIETDTNRNVYNELRKRAEDEGYILCGRLAEYKYLDMDDTIINALQVVNKILRDGVIA